jgi:hypothetical protein
MDPPQRSAKGPVKVSTRFRWRILLMDPFGGYDCRVPLIDHVGEFLGWTSVADPW